MHSQQTLLGEFNRIFSGGTKQETSSTLTAHEQARAWATLHTLSVVPILSALETIAKGIDWGGNTIPPDTFQDMHERAETSLAALECTLHEMNAAEYAGEHITLNASVQQQQFEALHGTFMAELHRINAIYYARYAEFCATVFH